MGGKGSGGQGRTSDEEKKANGTFRADRSEAVRAAADAAKVVTGPWLTSKPKPDYPLNDVGLKRYNEIIDMLWDQNKLTAVTKMHAENAAVAFQSIHQLASKGQPVRGSLLNQMQRALAALKIAEDAKPIENPEGKKNKFASSGFSSRLPQTG